MIKSMTGYGRGLYEAEGRSYTVEIRSVNNRYFDCTVKLPRSFSFAEEKVKQLVKQSITRGKVDVYISYQSQQQDGFAITLNQPVVEGYLAVMEEMAFKYRLENDMTVSKLARFADVFVTEKVEVDQEAIGAQLMEAVAVALDAFDAMRVAEGEALAKDLRNRANAILELTAKVEERTPVTLAEYRERITLKMQEVLEKTSIDESRILTEAAIYADKIAVDEETVRLRSHIDQLLQMLETGGPIGRKLDFLLQEMNRESNTIGSKGNDIQQARTVVDLKAELEKIREQTQNIE